MPAGLQVVESWPLIFVRFPRIVDAASISGMMSVFDRALERAAPFASVLDGSAIARLPGPEVREALTSWMANEARQVKEKRFAVASAVVVPSGLVRAFVAAIYFVRKPHAPQKWTETVPE